jgi:hypothetical protein
MNTTGSLTKSHINAGLHIIINLMTISESFGVTYIFVAIIIKEPDRKM